MNRMRMCVKVRRLASSSSVGVQGEAGAATAAGQGSMRVAAARTGGHSAEVG